ncbi:MAG: ArsR family transcriptional regulator [Alphaproteobacteria bacterium]|nr:MAG: ArsR family transcriptional regulator [Alphaproteobacteria bacterium]TAF15836.1 MAG: ArsR family transcriptional regulator [Alphaproteobacteria bacterium]TAF77266.1 MAG: ArsR family transcriptional regulator [Alphaproteobacteria bacterium]
MQKSYIEEVTQFLKLVANANRLLILQILLDGEANVGDLETQLGVSQPALSQHLARMRQEGILETRRAGQQIFYSVRDPRVVAMLKTMKHVFEDQSHLYADNSASSRSYTG